MKKVDRNVVLIISGYNSRGIISYCRFFSMNSIPFFIVSSGEEDSINYTSFKENVLFQRENSGLSISEFEEWKLLIRTRINCRKIVILPSTEFLNRFLIREKVPLEKIGFVIPLVEQELYECISNKYSFGLLCKEAGIKIPEEYKEPTEKDIPFVAKPKQYLTKDLIVNQRPVLILNTEELSSFNLSEEADEFYFQEFVHGESFYLLFYFNKLGQYSVYSQQNLIQQAEGLSIIGAKSCDFHKRNITQKFAELFLGLSFRGLVMIEVKLFKNKIYMIEANPRIWGPSQLIIDSGMNLLQQFSEDWNLIKRYEPADYITGMYYFWSGGLVEDQLKERKTVFHNYSEADFFKNYREWIKNDIYLRTDSISLYLKEIR